MFTGIVQACAPIASLERQPGRIRLGVTLPAGLTADLAVGASIALDGICMTVTGWEGPLVFFDAIQGTIDRTNIGDRDEGDMINVERSLKQGDEIGGHHVSGHVTECATVIGRDTVSAANYIDFTLPEPWRRYIFPRGFIALNGASLTVAEADDTLGIYRVNLIPETLRQTDLGRFCPGDRLNFEIDAQTQVIVDTVERTLARRGGAKSSTL